MNEKKIIDTPAHWIVVGEEWDADLEIKHSPDCPQGEVIVDADESGYEYGQGHTCAVAMYLDDNRLDESFYHADGENDYWKTLTPLTPGEHQVWLIERYYSPAPGVDQYDWWLTVENPSQVKQ